MLLIHGHPSSVAAIHARGMIFAESDSINVDMYILDDPALPIVLASGVVGGAGSGEGGRVVKITYPDSTLVSELEQQLASRKPAELYDIYFDYNEATITPQSDVTLHGLGLGAARLTTRGAGGGRSIATNATLEGRAKNRRVELRRL